MKNRTALVLAGSLVAATAFAGGIDPGQLPWFAHGQLQRCFDGDRAACDEVAPRVADPVWRAWLGGGVLSTLAPEEQLELQALRCAEQQGSACAVLGTQVMAESPLRATALWVRGCVAGEKTSCLPVGIRSRPRDALAWLANLPENRQQALELGPDEVPSVKLLQKIDKDCSRANDADAQACVDLIQIWGHHANRPTRGELFARLEQACHGDGPVCELVAELKAPDAPVFGFLADDAATLEHLCDFGASHGSCSLTQRVLELGRADPWGSWESRRMLAFGCDDSDQASCDALTRFFDAGLAEMTEPECGRAIAGQGGDPRACTETATAYRFGSGRPQDVARADELEDAACRAGDLRPCIWRANSAFDEDDQAAGMRWYRFACEGGDPVACGILGANIAFGEVEDPGGVPAGMALLKRSCIDGSSIGCGDLGDVAYQQNVAGAPSAQEASAIYLRACSLGSLYACYAYAGNSYDPNASESAVQGVRYLLRRTCEEGVPYACGDLGDMLSMGIRYVPVDKPGALAAYERACSLDEQSNCEDAQALRAEGVTPGPLTGGVAPPFTPSRAFNASHSYTVPSSAPASSGSSSSGSSKPPKPSKSSSGGGRPVIGRSFGLGVWASAGTQRSWSLSNQASSLRLGFDFAFGVVRLSAGVDLVSDNRWRPKVARSYKRTDAVLGVDVPIPVSGRVALVVGAGGVLGGYREGPGQTNATVFSGGPMERLGLEGNIAGTLRLGIRLEQQQLFQPALGSGVEHVTGLYGLLGVGLGSR